MTPLLAAKLLPEHGERRTDAWRRPPSASSSTSTISTRQRISWALRHRAHGDRRHPGGLRRQSAARAAHRHRVLPGHRREPVPHDRQGADRHPRRRDRAPGRAASRTHCAPTSRPNALQGRSSRASGCRRPRRRCTARTPARTRPTSRWTWSRQTSATQSTDELVNALRPTIVNQFPGVAIYFDPGGIVKRILNFGSAAPIDVEILGYDLEDRRARLTQDAARRHGATCPGCADIQVSREENYPELDVVVDREKAALLGLSEQQIANAVLFSLSATPPARPSPFTDPMTGNEYNIVAQLAEEFRDDPADLEDLFISADHGTPILLKNVASVQRGSRARWSSTASISSASSTSPPTRRGATSAASRRSWSGTSTISKIPPGFRCGSAVRPSSSARPSRVCASHGRGAGARLHGARVAVPVAARSAGHHVRVPLGLTGVLWALFLTHTTLSTHVVHGRHHDGRHRRHQRRAARRLRQRAAPPRDRAARGGDHRGAHAPAADLDDHARDDLRPPADGARDRRRAARPTCRSRAPSSAG